MTKLNCIVDSDFWRDLGNHFRALVPSEPVEEPRARWSINMDETQLQSNKKWELVNSSFGSSELMQTMKLAFEALARRGGTKLDASANSLGVWLEALIMQQPEDVREGGGTKENGSGEGVEFRFGTVRKIISRSADLCKSLESRALECERLAGQRQETRSVTPKEIIDQYRRGESLRSYEKLAARLGVSKDSLYAITKESRWLSNEMYSLVALACKCKPEDLHPRGLPRRRSD